MFMHVSSWAVVHEAEVENMLISFFATVSLSNYHHIHFFLKGGGTGKGFRGEEREGRETPDREREVVVYF